MLRLTRLTFQPQHRAQRELYQPFRPELICSLSSFAFLKSELTPWDSFYQQLLEFPSNFPPFHETNPAVILICARTVGEHWTSCLVKGLLVVLNQLHAQYQQVLSRKANASVDVRGTLNWKSNAGRNNSNTERKTKRLTTTLMSWRRSRLALLWIS